MIREDSLYKLTFMQKMIWTGTCLDGSGACSLLPESIQTACQLLRVYLVRKLPTLSRVLVKMSSLLVSIQCQE